ncbi:glycosyltransferase family 2 protein [Filimonas effusa]|uniref:Glycosyltransferase family 2 protein n=1 Tax=Filimonas effusa TaxID=2508721 RepID=A0A4Q1DEK7_9BACT|nr:glycosyltransferase family 2 protein [Filimonas effusa]RXK87123.1 glycosyltransferase family 2 protein [Filimonas effusa]
MHIYKDVTLLITHYNRPHSLERLLRSLQQAGIGFEEIIVSDDASDEQHFPLLQALQLQYKFTIIPGQVNKGLGHNLNKGQAAVKTSLVLYIQEDFEFTSLFIQDLPDAISIMNRDAQLDLVRFFAHARYPYLRPYSTAYEEMYMPLFATDYHKIYAYSDTPHLRRADFSSKFGPYKEGINADRTEYWMCVSFIRNKGRCVISRHYAGLFLHHNTPDEPSTIRRPGRQFSNNFFVRTARYWYRQIRYNFDLLS